MGQGGGADQDHVPVPRPQPFASGACGCEWLVYTAGSALPGTGVFRVRHPRRGVHGAIAHQAAHLLRLCTMLMYRALGRGTTQASRARRGSGTAMSDTEKYLQAFSGMYLQAAPSSSSTQTTPRRRHSYDPATIAAAEAATETAALEREARAVFVTHDVDCSGTIKDSELRRMLTAMGLPRVEVEAEVAGACWDGATMNLTTFVGYYCGLKARLDAVAAKARSGEARSWGRARSASHSGVGGSERGPRHVLRRHSGAGLGHRRASVTGVASRGLPRAASNGSDYGAGSASSASAKRTARVAPAPAADGTAGDAVTAASARAVEPGESSPSFG